jgi:glyoxylase-like metal-dependent hydrolase (beta-lactamase superfamily II)
MDVIELRPRLTFIRFPVGHAYLWRDADGLTLVDAGLPGSAPLLAEAVRRAGCQPADLRRLVLTHFHPDHVGGAAEVAGWGDVEVIAHRADAPFIRAEAAGPPPELADWERPLWDQVASQLPAGPRRLPRPAPGAVRRRRRRPARGRHGDRGRLQRRPRPGGRLVPAPGGP